jgi:hypothetical protein
MNVLTARPLVAPARAVLLLAPARGLAQVPGDVDGSGALDAADFAGLVAEVDDGDGTDPANAPTVPTPARRTATPTATERSTPPTCQRRWNSSSAAP